MASAAARTKQCTTFSDVIDSADFQLMPGTAVMVGVTNSGSSGKGIYVGMEPGRYMMLRLATSACKELGVRVGVELDIKFMHYAGLAGGFRVKVQSVQQNPAPLVFVSPPDKIEVLTRREEQRVDTFLPASAVYEEHVMHGCIRNLSQNGCLFSVLCSDGEEDSCQYADALEKDNGFEIDKEIACILRSPFSDEEHLFVGEIRSVVRRECAVDLGVQFTKVSSKLKNCIQQYLELIHSYTEAGKP